MVKSHGNQSPVPLALSKGRASTWDLDSVRYSGSAAATIWTRFKQVRNDWAACRVLRESARLRRT